MSKRVMVVDDTLFMRTKLKIVLEGLGHRVVAEAANGKEAVEKYVEFKPDVVTMDITMPVMDGLSALREIRALDAGAVVVMVSAMGQEDFVEKAILAGAWNYILKPFENGKIKAVMDRMKN